MKGNEVKEGGVGWVKTDIAETVWNKRLWDKRVWNEKVVGLMGWCERMGDEKSGVKGCCERGDVKVAEW